MAQSWTAERPEAEVTVNDASDIPLAVVEKLTVVLDGLGICSRILDCEDLRRLNESNLRPHRRNDCRIAKYAKLTKSYNSESIYVARWTRLH